MRGVILAIAPDGTYGQLSADDGQRYSYWTSEVSNGLPHVGHHVDFKMWEGQPVELFILANPVHHGDPPPQPQRAPAAQQPAAQQKAQVVHAGYAAAPAGYAAAPAGHAAAACRLRRSTGRLCRRPRRRRLWRRRRVAAKAVLDHAFHLAVGTHLAPAVLAARRSADHRRECVAQLDSDHRPDRVAGDPVGQHLHQLQTLPRSRLSRMVEPGLSHPGLAAVVLVVLGLVIPVLLGLSGCWPKSSRASAC